MKKNKKLFLGILILFIFLVSVISQYILKAPLGCGKSTNNKGWSCHFRDLTKFVEAAYKSKCANQNGKFSVGKTEPLGSYYFSCMIPYSDVGKSCSKSEDCLGSCQYLGTRLDKILPEGCKMTLGTKKGIFGTSGSDDKMVCSKNIVGECTEEKMGPCDSWNEVINNEVRFYTRFCMH